MDDGPLTTANLCQDDGAGTRNQRHHGHAVGTDCHLNGLGGHYRVLFFGVFLDIFFLLPWGIW
jgi:hypothetical protein